MTYLFLDCFCGKWGGRDSKSDMIGDSWGSPLIEEKGTARVKNRKKSYVLLILCETWSWNTGTYLNWSSILTSARVGLICRQSKRLQSADRNTSQSRLVMQIRNGIRSVWWHPQQVCSRTGTFDFLASLFNPNQIIWRSNLRNQL